MGVSGRSPQRSPGAEPLVRGGKAPPEAESFLTFGHQTEIITFVFFAIFCKLRMPNRSYTIQCIGYCQDLTKCNIRQILNVSVIK